MRISLLALSREEKIDLHRAVRERRRTFNPTNRAVKKEVEKKKVGVTNAFKSLNKMTPEQAKAFLTLIEGA